MIERLRYWYDSDRRPAVRFRYGLLLFDIVTVAFVVASSFTRDTWWVEALDVIFGLLILADFIARLAISQHRFRDLAHPATWADVVAILSFLPRAQRPHRPKTRGQHSIAKRRGDTVEACLKAARAATAYRKAKDESRSRVWRATSKEDCAAAGLPGFLKAT